MIVCVVRDAHPLLHALSDNMLGDAGAEVVREIIAGCPALTAVDVGGLLPQPYRFHYDSV